MREWCHAWRESPHHTISNLNAWRIVAEIFISYRRDDTGGHAGRLRDHLRAKFGDLVFQDVDNIPDGAVFETVLASALSSAKVGVVVIGPHWLTTADAAGHRRLDDPNDWVRTEIRQLLARDIPVIPVLVGGVRSLDATALPDDLRPLAGRQIRVLSDESWSSGVDALTTRLSTLVRAPRKRRSAVIAADVRASSDQRTVRPSLRCTSRSTGPNTADCDGTQPASKTPAIQARRIWIRGSTSRAN